MLRFFLSVLSLPVLLFSTTFAIADGPADNRSDEVRRIPPPGMELSEEQKSLLLDHCRIVRNDWKQVLEAASKVSADAKKWQKADAEARLSALHDLEPEVLVFPRAVEMSLQFQQFYSEKDVESAKQLLEIAKSRLKRAKTTASWRDVVGLGNADLDAAELDGAELGDSASRQLIVGGYKSNIDQSYQPYAIVVPSGFVPGDARERRLDIWFHGRGEKLSEVGFLTKGRVDAGQYTPNDTYVLHPYGRYSNAFKFAGEIDVLETLEHVQRHLPVDQSKISVRGFSMGGAACWQFATHYADRFFAANPGAGFSETPEFLKSFQSEDLSGTPDYQRVLWRLYDCPPWSRNLVHCPTVAYSGEIDRQKQAADVMVVSMAERGIDLVHVIGPDTAHKIHPESKVEIERRIGLLAEAATSAVPKSVDLTTYTLRYNRMHWVQALGLSKHWEESRITARVLEEPGAGSVQVDTHGVEAFRLDFKSGQWPSRFPSQPDIVVDGTRIEGPPVRSDLSWTVDLFKRDGQWSRKDSDASEMRKRPGLQGPIDDAFLSSFVFVTPSKKSADETLQRWYASEASHAMTHWQQQFRGDVQQVTDQALTEDQIKNSNLILFGDPTCNLVIAKIADKLPVKWKEDAIEIGNHSYPSGSHVPLLIYPNPLNSDKYIVLNSGFTYREYDYLNNARQTPKLPDWAIVDVADGATYRDPGRIKAAGFFNESWKP